MSLIAFLLLIVQILVVLAVFSTWSTVNEMAARQRKTEEVLVDIQERLRRQGPLAPPSEPAIRTCIRCLTTVPRKEEKCPQCGHFFDQA